MNSRQKGARGERELARWLTEEGFPAKRGQQRSGLEEQDVICPALDPLWFEVKRTEKLSLYRAMDQAIRDAGASRIPSVWHRRNGREWLVCFRADDFLSRVLKP